MTIGIPENQIYYLGNRETLDIDILDCKVSRINILDAAKNQGMTLDIDIFCGRSSVVEHRPSKPNTSVRFRSPAP